MISTLGKKSDGKLIKRQYPEACGVQLKQFYKGSS